MHAVLAFILIACSTGGSMSRRDASFGRRPLRFAADGASAPAVPDEIELLIMGQSNALDEGQLITATLPRYDILETRWTGAGVNEYKTSWAPLGPAYRQGGNPLTDRRGISVRCCINLKDVHGRRFHLINNAVSGIGFGRVGAAGHWMPPNRNGGVGGTIFQRAVTLVNATRAAHLVETSVTYPWLVWVHGEADSTSDLTAAEYYDNLTAFYSDFRTATGVNWRPYVVRLSNNATGAGVLSSARATTQAAQDAFGAANPNAIVRNTDSLAMGGDNIHYSTASANTLGAWIAADIHAASP